ncbi:hypothetical protein P20480_0863 [Pseudoalteromonas sp. BSi20480]|nr:hypothetical protein P20480_0863 [Pseudoalteromonas sp. BSi20480]
MVTAEQALKPNTTNPIINDFMFVLTWYSLSVNKPYSKPVK